MINIYIQIWLKEVNPLPRVYYIRKSDLTCACLLFSLVRLSAYHRWCVAPFIALTSIILVDLLGLPLLSSAFGLLCIFRGFAGIVSSPLAGTAWHTHLETYTMVHTYSYTYLGTHILVLTCWYIHLGTHILVHITRYIHTLVHISWYHH